MSEEVEILEDKVNNLQGQIIELEHMIVSLVHAVGLLNTGREYSDGYRKDSFMRFGLCGQYSLIPSDMGSRWVLVNNDENKLTKENT